MNASFRENGFAIIESIYSPEEVDALISLIDGASGEQETFRRSAGLFAIRQFLKEIPEAIPAIFNTKLREVIANHLGPAYFPVKSIYFDKPPGSNWFVAYHQDLTISVDKKTDLEGYSSWTVKQNQFAVQPPLAMLENGVTLRIHLDDTDEHNGALNVLKGSHRKGIYRPETIATAQESEYCCRVKKGGLMLMKPLLMHASQRSSSERRRRVIHIEFSDMELPEGLQWAERLNLTNTMSVG